MPSIFVALLILIWIPGFALAKELDIGRKLLTEDRVHDVQFDDLKKTYYFGIAVFDNDGANVHTRSLDPIGLMYK